MKLFILLINIAFANDIDFVKIEKGKMTPFQGVLLTEEALAEIITKNEREVEQCKIDAEYQKKILSSEFQLKYDLLKITSDSNEKMYLDMISVRDEKIEKDKKRDVLQKWSSYGAFILGVSTTIGITYAVNQNFK